MPTDEIELYQRLVKVEENVKSNQHRIDDVEKIVESIHTLASETKALREDMSDIKSDVDELKNKPVKRFDSIMDKVILTIVGAVVGVVLVKLGL